MERNHLLPLNGFLYSQLRIVSELRGIDCAETVAEMWIREKLDSMPEIAELAKLRADHRKAADKEWHAMQQLKKTE